MPPKSHEAPTAHPMNGCGRASTLTPTSGRDAAGGHPEARPAMRSLADGRSRWLRPRTRCGCCADGWARTRSRHDSRELIKPARKAFREQVRAGGRPGRGAPARGAAPPGRDGAHGALRAARDAELRRGGRMRPKRVATVEHQAKSESMTPHIGPTYWGCPTSTAVAASSGVIVARSDRLTECSHKPISSLT